MTQAELYALKELHRSLGVLIVDAEEQRADAVGDQKTAAGCADPMHTESDVLGGGVIVSCPTCRTGGN